MTGTEQPHTLIAWLSEPSTLDGIFAEPLRGAFSLAPSTRWGILLTIVINVYLWLFGFRLFYSIVGRWLGFYNPLHFRYFLLPWRPLWKTYRHLLQWREEVFVMGRVASARWMSVLDRLCLVYKPDFIFLGRHRAAGISIQQPAGCDGERHVTVIAGPGAGKTTYIISWLAMHPGSAYVIDPKGQIARTIVNRKGAGGKGVFGQGKKVRVLDPMRQVRGHPSAKWNLFDTLHAVERRSGRDAVVRYAVKAAFGLIMDRGENPFWPGSSKEFITGAILDVYTCEPRERQTLARLYDLLANGLVEECRTPQEDAMAVWLWRMKNNKSFDGVIAASANALADAGKETYGNILVTIREQLQWLKLPEVRTVCGSGSAETDSDVDLEELASEQPGMLLFLCAPATDVRGPLAGWFRLLTVMALYIFEDLNRKLRCPCLFLLDEFPALGRLDSVQVAAGLMRSMGVRLVVIAQDLGQLRIYPNHETFLGSAEACLFMATNHQETLSYITRTLGVRTIRRKVKSGWWFTRTARHELREEPLMREEALKRVLGRGNIVCILAGNRPLITTRTSYFNYLPTYFFDNDPDHGELLLRRPMRRFFTWLLPGKVEPVRPVTPLKPVPEG